MRSRLSRWARSRATRSGAAAAGGALLVTGLVLGPASDAFGLTDPLTTVTPAIDGSGSLTGAGGYLCNATNQAGTTTLCTTSIDLGGLLGVTQTELVPTALPGWSFDSWTQCPGSITSAGGCLIDTSLLDTGLLGSTLEPIAKFLPTPLGSTAPDTAITTTPTVDADGDTAATDAAFAFKVVASDAAPAFECSLTGPGQSGGFTGCGTGSPTGTMSYSGLAPGQYSFAVRALDGPTADPTPAVFSWTVSSPAPTTRLHGGPRQLGWLHSGQVAFRLSSDQPGASYRCTVDGHAHRCGNRLVLRHVAAGTHTVTATAVTGKQVDATPARRTFTRPVGDRALRHSRGWQEHTGRRGYFLHSFSQTRKAGASLSFRARHIKRIALVAAKGRRYGLVEVYLGRRLLRRVPLHAHRLRKEAIIPVIRFTHRRHGLVRVVVVSRGRLVRVEGLGIARR